MSGSFFLERALQSGTSAGGSFSHNAAILKFGQSVDYEALTISGRFSKRSARVIAISALYPSKQRGGGVRKRWMPLLKPMC